MQVGNRVRVTVSYRGAARSMVGRVGTVVNMKANTSSVPVHVVFGPDFDPKESLFSLDELELVDEESSK